MLDLEFLLVEQYLELLIVELFLVEWDLKFPFGERELWPLFLVRESKPLGERDLLLMGDLSCFLDLDPHLMRD